MGLNGEIMATLTQPLRDEHKELMPHVESLNAAADAIREILATSDLVVIDEALSFLTDHLLPHAKAEEKALYPVVRKVMGSVDGTSTMSRDHVEIEKMTKELVLIRSKIKVTRITMQQATAFRRLFYGLYAIVKLHFAKEEEVYLPLLDKNLKPEEAKAMFVAMELAAHEAKANL
jgi:hemerythrin-like domain-containing protein